MNTLLRPVLTGRRRWLAAVFLCVAATASVHAADDDDFVIDLPDNMEFGALAPMELRVTPNLVAEALEKIKDPLWQHTRAPAARDILYSLPYKITAVEYGGFAVKAFFNMTNRMQVTAKNLFADAASLSAASSLLPTDLISAQDFAQLVPLFQKITLQERKAGLLLQAGASQGPFTFQVHTSLQLGERNFWLSKRDVEAINAAMKDNFSSGMSTNELMKIRTGPGDTRIKLGFNTLNMTNFQNDIGVELILPTSQLRAHADEGPGLVTLDFDPADPAAAASAKENALRTLRGIRDYLLNPRLGNRGHFGVGCYIEQKFGLFHDTVQLWVRASYDIIFAGDEVRMYMFNKTITPAGLHGLGEDYRLADLAHDPLIPATVAAFAVAKSALVDGNTKYVRQYVLPSSFKSNIQPGGIANIVMAANFDINKHWRGALGYDFYLQRQEEVKRIYSPEVDISELNVKGAEFARAMQHKCFSEILYHNKTKRNDFGVGLGGDFTVAASGIGADWTTYIKCSVAF